MSTSSSLELDRDGIGLSSLRRKELLAYCKDCSYALEKFKVVGQGSDLSKL